MQRLRRKDRRRLEPGCGVELPSLPITGFPPIAIRVTPLRYRLQKETPASPRRGGGGLNEWSSSYPWRARRAGRGGAGKTHHEDFSFVMPVSQASPKLMLACSTGDHIKKAVLTCRKAGKGQVEYYKIVLTDVLVTSFKTGGNGSSLMPVDQVA